ncbi:MAG: desulfoferrodoxin [Pirellulales bacterium]|nr:desulfoferrodoxin [Pirellulales bacterium]
MAQQRQVLSCDQCRNVVEVLHGGPGELNCCGKPMRIAAENTADASREKHVPAVARAGGELTVTVGTLPHPMAEEHYIEWIEIAQGNAATRRYLTPGAVPQATFEVLQGPVTARAYCNLHGLWRADV